MLRVFFSVSFLFCRDGAAGGCSGSGSGPGGAGAGGAGAGAGTKREGKKKKEEEKAARGQPMESTRTGMNRIYQSLGVS